MSLKNFLANLAIFQTTIKVFQKPLFTFKCLSFILLGLFLWTASSSLRSLGEQESFSLLPTLSHGNYQEFLQKDSSQMILIEGNSIKGFSSPLIVSNKVLATLIQGEVLPTKRNKIIEYTIQQGDSLSGIANRFNISLNTLLWANNLTTRSTIRPNQNLIILPVSGVMHLVGLDETLSQITFKYQGKAEEIVEFNNLIDNRVQVGDIIIIPDGQMSKIKPRGFAIPLANYHFICPIPYPCNVVQGLHFYNAVDFSNDRCGEPVYAVAGGIIQKTGHSPFAGYYVRILHPNNVVTFYGQLSRILVGSGDKVFQGKLIGHTGYDNTSLLVDSKNCYLHFEVRGARNPFIIE